MATAMMRSSRRQGLLERADLCAAAHMRIVLMRAKIAAAAFARCTLLLCSDGITLQRSARRPLVFISAMSGAAVAAG
jgi:hypothetical protein